MDEVGNGTRDRGDYALLEVMGDPGSEVFRARTRDGRSVVLRFWRGDSELETRNALGLLDLATRVQHPMLATVYRCERFADGSLRVVSEYVPGRSLDAWVGEAGVPPLTIGLDFVRRLALALVDAHRLGVTHHALYPGNIVVLEPETRPHGRIAAKLVDLGIARSMRTATRFEAAHFMAPESLAQELDSPSELQQVDARMNVYSCGCLLHYLSTGQPPYQSDSLENLRAVHRSGRPAVPARLNPNIPEEFERVICQALALDPKRRTPDMAALARALSYVESQWRSSSVRNKAQPPPLPVRDESPAPQPSAAASARRLAPAIAAALSLRPIPQRNTVSPEAPPRERRRTSPPPPPPAHEAVELELSQVALEPAAELDHSGATEAIVIEPIGITDPIRVANDAVPAEPLPAAALAVIEQAPSAAEAPAPEVEPAVAAVMVEPTPSGAEAAATDVEQAVAAVVIEQAPSLAEAPASEVEQAVAATVIEPTPSVVESPAPEAGQAIAATVIEPMPSAVESPAPEVQHVAAAVLGEPAPNVVEAAALEETRAVAVVEVEQAPNAVEAAVSDVSAATSEMAAVASSAVAPSAAPEGSVSIVDAPTVVSSHVARPASARPGEDFADAVDAAAERISNPEIGRAPEIHSVVDEPSVVISAAVFRNSLSPVEVAGRRRSDGLPRRVVSDVIVPPRAPAAPASRRWRWGAAALAGASVYWLLMSLRSSPEPAIVAVPLIPASVAQAPASLPAPAPAPEPE
ncbi:MAG TPA: hypothetical protein VJV78_25370, partial [Polyangiales bacterium]|nr:hypothetical protein [Polyangiales bacterium]